MHNDLGPDGLCAVALDKKAIEEEDKPIACAYARHWKLASEVGANVDISSSPPPRLAG